RRLRHGLPNDVHFNEGGVGLQGGTAVGLCYPDPAICILCLQERRTRKLVPQTLFDHTTHLKTVGARIARSCCRDVRSYKAGEAERMSYSNRREKTRDVRSG